MLFIVPAFILCLLFTNLEPRLLIYIFQDWVNNELNLRQQLCRFNLLHYGSILAIYPLLMLTNFNYLLFIGISCLFFPQIYTNALSSTRPNLNSHYYMKYLLSRFLLVVMQWTYRYIYVATLTTFFPYNQTTCLHWSVCYSSQFKYQKIDIVRPNIHSEFIWGQKGDSKIPPRASFWLQVGIRVQCWGRSRKPWLFYLFDSSAYRSSKSGSIRVSTQIQVDEDTL